MQIHRCLEIQEIIILILRELRNVQTRSAYLNTLYRLAQTARGFTEPALDLLWHSQTSLAPLVGCLPADAICVYRKAIRPDGRDWIVSLSNLYM